jgi:peroxiredoxin
MASWKEKFSFQYDLLSDPDQVLIAAVGAKDGDKTTRSHGKIS